MKQQDCIAFWKDKGVLYSADIPDILSIQEAMERTREHLFTEYSDYEEPILLLFQGGKE